MAENTVKGQAQQVVDLAAKKASRFIMSQEKLDQMVSGQHQGVVAQVAAYEYAELDDLFKRPKTEMNSRLSLY